MNRPKSVEKWLNEADPAEVADALHALPMQRLVSVLQLLAEQKRAHAQKTLHRAGRTMESPQHLIAKILGAILS